MRKTKAAMDHNRKSSISKFHLKFDFIANDDSIELDVLRVVGDTEK